MARALRHRYPHALLVVCGDDDINTAALTGNNPGRVKATEAARAVGAVAVFPEGLPSGGSDFNDMAAQYGGDGTAGLAAVCATAQRAIEAAQQAPAASPTAPPNAKTIKGKGRAAATPSGGAGGLSGVVAAGVHGGVFGGAGSPPAGPGDRHTEPSDGPPDWDRFNVTDAGVFHQGVDRDGKPAAPEWVCSRLDVEALTRDQDGQGWGYLLTFANPVGKPKQWAMPARMLAGDGGEYRGALLGMGLRIAPSPRARNLVTQYI